MKGDAKSTPEQYIIYMQMCIFYFCPSRPIDNLFLCILYRLESLKHITYIVDWTDTGSSYTTEFHVCVTLSKIIL